MAANFAKLPELLQRGVQVGECPQQPREPAADLRRRGGQHTAVWPRYANRTFRGDGLTDAIGPCASVAVVQQFGSYRRQSGHAIDIAEPTRLTRMRHSA
jgi:hypothetical protein